MNPKRSWLVGFLVLAVLGEAGWIFQLNRRLTAARLDLAKSEASLQKSSADFRQRTEELQRQVAAGRSFAGRSSPAARAAANARGPDLAKEFLHRQTSPEGLRLRTLQRKGEINTNFADLFRLLRLPPDQLAQLKDLLLERDAGALDVQVEAMDHGLTNPQAVQQLIAATRAETDEKIKAAIGEAAFAEYQFYQKTPLERAVVRQLQTSVSYTETPLGIDLGEQLVKLLNQNLPPPGPDLATLNVARISQVNGLTQIQTADGRVITPRTTALITDAVLAQAQAFLAPSQLEALRTLQQQQQATIALQGLNQPKAP